MKISNIELIELTIKQLNVASYLINSIEGNDFDPTSNKYKAFSQLIELIDTLALERGDQHKKTTGL